jgi:hypothetical protein
MACQVPEANRLLASNSFRDTKGLSAIDEPIEITESPSIPIVAAIQTAMRSFRVISNASTACSLPSHCSRNALSQNRNDAVVRLPYSLSVRKLPALCQVADDLWNGKDPSMDVERTPFQRMGAVISDIS